LSKKGEFPPKRNSGAKTRPLYSQPLDTKEKKPMEESKFY
jgi:hypothetical protein